MELTHRYKVLKQKITDRKEAFDQFVDLLDHTAIILVMPVHVIIPRLIGPRFNHHLPQLNHE